MAKQKFVHYVPRPKPKKRPGVHKKSKIRQKKGNRKKLDIKVKAVDNYHLISYSLYKKGESYVVEYKTKNSKPLIRV
jgi:hypothetical protein